MTTRFSSDATGTGESWYAGEVKEGYFYYPNEWNNRKTQFDSYAGTCRDKEELGLEPLKRAK